MCSANVGTYVYGSLCTCYTKQSVLIFHIEFVAAVVVVVIACRATFSICHKAISSARSVFPQTYLAVVVDTLKSSCSSVCRWFFWRIASFVRRVQDNAVSTLPPPSERPHEEFRHCLWSLGSVSLYLACRMSIQSIGMSLEDVFHLYTYRKLLIYCDIWQKYTIQWIKFLSGRYTAHAFRMEKTGENWRWTEN